MSPRPPPSAPLLLPALAVALPALLFLAEPACALPFHALSSHPTPLRHRFELSPLVPARPDFHPRVSHRGIEDVGPALANATQNALTHADAILANYSNVLRGIAIPAGLGVSFFGYFLLAPVLFIAAFITGGGACFVAVTAVLDNTTPTAAWIAIGAMLLGGALFGFLAMRALNLGMFAVGAALGVVFTAALRNPVIAPAFPDDPGSAFIAIAVSVGLVLGLLAVFLQKQMLIFSTAYAGACACAFGIGHFAGHFPSEAELAAAAEQGHVGKWVAVYVAITLALGTAGMLFQFWLATDRPMPDAAPHSRRRRRARRRVVQHFDPDEWSDGEADWGSAAGMAPDDVYVERTPIPRFHAGDPRAGRQYLFSPGRGGGGREGGVAGGRPFAYPRPDGYGRVPSGEPRWPYSAAGGGALAVTPFDGSSVEGGASPSPSPSHTSLSAGPRPYVAATAAAAAVPSLTLMETANPAPAPTQMETLLIDGDDDAGAQPAVVAGPGGGAGGADGGRDATDGDAADDKAGARGARGSGGASPTSVAGAPLGEEGGVDGRPAILV